MMEMDCISLLRQIQSTSFDDIEGVEQAIQFMQALIALEEKAVSTARLNLLEKVQLLNSLYHNSMELRRLLAVKKVLGEDPTHEEVR